MLSKDEYNDFVTQVGSHSDIGIFRINDQAHTFRKTTVQIKNRSLNLLTSIDPTYCPPTPLTMEEEKYIIENLEFTSHNAIINGEVKLFKFWIISDIPLYDEELVYTLRLPKESLLYCKIKLGVSGVSVKKLKNLLISMS